MYSCFIHTLHLSPSNPLKSHKIQLSVSDTHSIMGFFKTPANVQPTHSPTHTYTFGCVTPFDAHTYPRECKYSNTFVYCYCRLWLSGGIDVVIWLSTVDTPETTNRAEAQ